MEVESVRMNPGGLQVVVEKKKRFALDRMWFTQPALLKKSHKTS